MHLDQITNECDQTENLIAYIYGELDSTVRSSFEKHIVECRHCGLESSELSFASGMIKQWKGSDVDTLNAPITDLDRIINYPEPVSVPNMGWFEGIVEKFRLPRIATVGFSFGSLIISTVILAIFIISYENTAEISKIDVPVASNITINDRPIDKGSSDPQSKPNSLSDDSGIILPVQKITDTKIDQKSIKPIKAVKVNGPRKNNITVIETSTPNLATTEKAPRLTQYEEFSDDSLRLSDLMDDFEDVGSS